jgi:hypothetical protein
MSLYGLSRSGVSMASGADLIAIITASNRRVELTELTFKCNGATSAAAADEEAQFGPCTAPSGGSPTSVTASKLDPDSTTPASTTAYGHTTPSATFIPALIIGGNLYGGGMRWTARQKGEVKARNGQSISLQQKTGTGAVSFHTIFDEI